ncbi:TPA: hypothetical protein EYP66_12125 [Candidatus Poribacteria bacterium]|nr:hypothetical protein [Candidatus Poribacteria bacterium]
MRGMERLGGLEANGAAGEMKATSLTESCPFLTYHLGGGEGGIASYLEHIGPTMAERWKSLGSFTSLSKKDREKLIEEVSQMEMVRAISIEELVKWRDLRLAALLKTQNIIGEKKDEE